MATQGMNLSSSGLKFTTQATERAIISNNGRFGLGELVPTAMFHVVPTGTTETIILEGLDASSSNTNFLVSDASGVIQTRNDIAVGTVITAVTENANVVTVSDNQAASTSFTIDAITTIDYDNSWGLDSNGTGTFSGDIELPFITSGSYAAGTITLVINGGLESDITIPGIDGTDTFVTGSSLNAGTVTLTRNDSTTIATSGFGVVVAGDDDSSTVNLGGTISILGSSSTGISTVNTAGSVVVSLDNTGVGANSYGDANTIGTFTVDAQGRLTSATDVDISITASQVSDFTSASETAIFTTANFVDSSEIDFTVSAGASVTGGLINGSIANARLVNSSLTFNTITGTNPVVDLGGTLNFVSTNGSVTILGASGTDTIDIEVNSTNIDNIYTANGTLSGARTVTQSGNLLRFTGGDVEFGGGDFHYDNTNDNVGIGSSTPASDAKLEVSSTTQGFLFPRMTEAQRLAMGTSTTGMMVYQTDVDEGVYIYKSFGWVQVI